MFTAVLFIRTHTRNFSDVHNGKRPPNVKEKEIGVYSPHGKLYSIEDDQYTTKHNNIDTFHQKSGYKRKPKVSFNVYKLCCF